MIWLMTPTMPENGVTNADANDMNPTTAPSASVPRPTKVMPKATTHSGNTNTSAEDRLDSNAESRPCRVW